MIAIIIGLSCLEDILLYQQKKKTVADCAKFHCWKHRGFYSVNLLNSKHGL